MRGALCDHDDMGRGQPIRWERRTATLADGCTISWTWQPAGRYPQIVTAQLDLSLQRGRRSLAARDCRPVGASTRQPRSPAVILTPNGVMSATDWTRSALRPVVAVDAGPDWRQPPRGPPRCSDWPRPIGAASPQLEREARHRSRTRNRPAPRKATGRRMVSAHFVVVSLPAGTGHRGRPV